MPPGLGIERTLLTLRGDYWLGMLGLLQSEAIEGAGADDTKFLHLVGSGEASELLVCEDVSD